MGVHENIGFLRFPKQGPWLGKRVRVVFDYDTAFQIEGTIVRDDAEEPFRTIIHVDVSGARTALEHIGGESDPTPSKGCIAPLTLTLPMPAPVTNRRTGNGWRTVHAEKVGYAKACDELQRAGLIPPPPPKPFAKATIASVMHLGHAMDEDNAMARHKVSIDWLRTRGYIADDRKKCLRWAGLPEQIVKRGGDYRLVITLTPSEL